MGMGAIRYNKKKKESRTRSWIGIQIWIENSNYDMLVPKSAKMRNKTSLKVLCLLISKSSRVLCLFAVIVSRRSKLRLDWLGDQGGRRGALKTQLLTFWPLNVQQRQCLKMLASFVFIWYWECWGEGGGLKNSNIYMLAPKCATKTMFGNPRKLCASYVLWLVLADSGNMWGAGARVGLDNLHVEIFKSGKVRKWKRGWARLEKSVSD